MLDALPPERREEAANDLDGNGISPLFLAGTRGSHPDCLKELISDGARYNGIKVTVKTAGNVMLAAMRMKRKAGLGGVAPAAAKADAPAAEAQAVPATSDAAPKSGESGAEVGETPEVTAVAA